MEQTKKYIAQAIFELSKILNTENPLIIKDSFEKVDIHLHVAKSVFELESLNKR